MARDVVVAQLREEIAFLRDLTRTLTAQLAAREARTATTVAAPVAPVAVPPTPEAKLDAVVEQAIVARTYDPVSERLTRQYAQQMAARGMKPEALALAIQRGALPRESAEDELLQVVR